MKFLLVCNIEPRQHIHRQLPRCLQHPLLVHCDLDLHADRSLLRHRRHGSRQGFHHLQDDKQPHEKGELTQSYKINLDYIDRLSVAISVQLGYT